MAVPRDRYYQFELFPSHPTAAVPKKQMRLFPTRLTLSVENLVILAVVIMMSMVVSFSLGVERGKGVAFKMRVPEPALPDAAASGNAERTLPEASSDRLLTAPAVPPETVLPATAEAAETRKTAAPGREKGSDAFYTVQVASYVLDKYAQKEASNLKQKGYESIVLPKGRHSIVCIGRFALKGDANAMSRKLKKTYKDCLVRRL